jgi:dolichyl-diphosphooligosaccharide--protein glycosyltransferase
MSEANAGEAGAPNASPAPPARSATLLERAGLATVLIVATLPRLLSVRLLFSRGEVMQWDGDSAYHLKRLLYSIAHFPGVLRFDGDLNWPKGAVCVWPDGFDLLGAAWGLGAGLGDPRRAAIAVLLFTTVLALFAVWAAMDLARLVIPDGPAKAGAVVATGLLTGLMPSALYHSQVGYLDHHIAELLSFLLLAGWALRRVPRRGSIPAPGLAWEAGGALAATFALWVFAGGVLYVAMAFAIVVAAVLRDERPRLVGSGILGLAASAAIAALLTLPSLRLHGHVFSYTFPSLLQPLLVAAASTALGLAWTSTRLAGGASRRVIFLVATGLMALGVAAWLAPQAASQVRGGLEGWLLRRDPWIASISEFQPFGWNSPILLGALFSTYGALGVFAPLVLAAGGWIIVRATGPRGVAFLILSATFVALSLHQVRFDRIGLPLLMINVAAVLSAVAQRARDTAGHPIARGFPILATVVLIAADPNLRAGLSRVQARIPPPASAALALRDLARGADPQGALSAWDQGHFVTFFSGLATPTSGFGSYLDPESFEATEAVFRGDERSLDRYLDERRIRWVIAGPLTSNLVSVDDRSFMAPLADRPGNVLNLEYMRSFGLSPLVIGGSAIPGSGVRHLEHLMPVFGTREQPTALTFPLPALWIYERVKGARLEGLALPGARVVASLDFREQGRPHVWRAFADAGADGRFSLTVPFPTGLVRHGLSSAPRYAVQAGDGALIDVEVPERAVREGDSIAVARLPAAKASAH